MEALITQTNKDVLVVYFTDVNLTNAQRIAAVGEQLLEAMMRAEHGKLLLNFQVVRMMSSAMLGRLLALKKQCDKSKVDLKLSNVCDGIKEVFAVTGLAKVFDLHETEADAMRAFEKKGWLLCR